VSEAGYSRTPLPKKLGLKPGQRVAFVNLPADLLWLAEAEAFSELHREQGVEVLAPRQAQGEEFLRTPSPHPESVEGRGRAAGGLDLIHAFYTDAARLTADLPALRQAIAPSGAVWISWPKGASKVSTDITEDVIRAAALDMGLVDVKVCAVSDVWSGLKLVIPVALRGARR
jgi:hypothetical protein